MASPESARFVYKVAVFLVDNKCAVVSNTWLFEEDVSMVYLYRYVYVATPGGLLPMKCVAHQRSPIFEKVP